MRKFFLPLLGAIVAVLVDLLIHYLAAATLNLPFIQQLFSPLGIAVLVILVFAGLIIGVRIDKSKESEPSPSSTPRNPVDTGLKDVNAHLSNVKLRGKGIQMDRVSSFGSKFDIDTRSKPDTETGSKSDIDTKD